MSADANRGPVSKLFTKTNAAVQADRDVRLRVEELVQNEAGNLLGYFSRRVSSPADAADLLGDTLLVLWRRAGSIPNSAEEARMWMFGVARKVLTTHRRGLSRRLALADRLRGELAAQSSATGLDGSTLAASTDERMEAVMASMSELSESDREIITLIHGDGFTAKDAAHLLHIRAATARSRYHRARNRLKERVEAALAMELKLARRTLDS
ncbi:RNA polymerase sigma factor [Rhodoglobus sp.]